MESRLRNNNYYSSAFLSEQEETDTAQENGAESPPSDTVVTSTSSPKRSRRAIQKRVVQIPIKDAEGPRLKGESNTPPSDSWAWRKYGQKPIKGSPYPRGYYRCSSSKGCPARKQVERSRVDPSMLDITYFCEHNHPCPASRTNKTTTTVVKNDEVFPNTQSDPEPEPEPEKEEENFTDLGNESLMRTDEFGWIGGMEATSCRVYESPNFTGDDADVASGFVPMREEDESLFADLGELPECAMVFRRGVLEREEERRRCATPWCGTTS